MKKSSISREHNSLVEKCFRSFLELCIITTKGLYIAPIHKGPTHFLVASIASDELISTTVATNSTIVHGIATILEVIIAISVVGIAAIEAIDVSATSIAASKQILVVIWSKIIVVGGDVSIVGLVRSTVWRQKAIVKRNVWVLLLLLLLLLLLEAVELEGFRIGISIIVAACAVVATYWMLSVDHVHVLSTVVASIIWLEIAGVIIVGRISVSLVCGWKSKEVTWVVELCVTQLLIDLKVSWAHLLIALEALELLLWFLHLELASIASISTTSGHHFRIASIAPNLLIAVGSSLETLVLLHLLLELQLFLLISFSFESSGHEFIFLVKIFEGRRAALSLGIRVSIIRLESWRTTDSSVVVSTALHA